MPATKKEKKLNRPPLVLVILDGWGLAPAGPYNAITQAKTPTIDNLWKNSPHTIISAHGLEVGLPDGQVGNSEAGHINLGAGRVVTQDSVEISRAITDGSFFKNPALLKAVKHVKAHKSQLHIIGILSGQQCPHMSPDHVAALSKLAYKEHVPTVWHFFTDGRDSLPHAALQLWKKLKPRIAGDGVRVGTVAGRYYLDRKKEWSRTEKIYNALVLGEADYEAKSLRAAIRAGYARGESDEFLAPTLIRNNNISARDNISDDDAIIFYNLRSDRARQATKPFVQIDFEGSNQGAFKRRKILRNILFVALTDFGPDLDIVQTAFPAGTIPQTLPYVLRNHYKQLYISEMEKYAHMTYFFNGGFARPIAEEGRILVQSKNVVSYDETPKMATPEITKVIVESLRQRWYNFVCVNLCNADMLGHTGNLRAARIGCEVIDQSLAKIVKVVKAQGGNIIITADHGNAEIMGRLTAEGEEIIDTTHETSSVPLIINTKREIKLKEGTPGDPSGNLASVAPTLLDLVGIEKPKEMTGESLIENF